MFPAILKLVLAHGAVLLWGVACQAQSSQQDESGPPKQKQPQDSVSTIRFGTVLNEFSVNGTSVFYALGLTLDAAAGANETNDETTDETEDEIRFYCSLNGSPFERCHAQGNIPSSRLILGINVFQAQAVVLGKESANPLYHEFFIGGEQEQ